MRKILFFVILFYVLFAENGAELQVSFVDSRPTLSNVLVGYVYHYSPASSLGEYTLRVIMNQSVLYETNFSRQYSALCYDTPSRGGCEETEVPFSVIVPFEHHSQLVEIRKGNELLFISALSDYICNEDGICSGRENFLSCPSDCSSGGLDNFCDRMEDGICDPDCLSSADLDCEPKNDSIITLAQILNPTGEEEPTCVDVVFGEADYLLYFFIYYCCPVLFLIGIVILGLYLYKKFRKNSS